MIVRRYDLRKINSLVFRFVQLPALGAFWRLDFFLSVIQHCFKNPSSQPARQPGQLHRRPPTTGCWVTGCSAAAVLPICRSANQPSSTNQPAGVHQLARQQTNNRATASYSTANQASGVFYARKSNFFTCTRNVSEGGAIAANGSNSHTWRCYSLVCLFVCFNLGFTPEWESLLDRKFCPTPKGGFGSYWNNFSQCSKKPTVNFFICNNWKQRTCLFVLWVPFGSMFWIQFSTATTLPRQSTVNFFTCMRNVANGSNSHTWACVVFSFVYLSVLIQGSHLSV